MWSQTAKFLVILQESLKENKKNMREGFDVRVLVIAAHPDDEVYGMGGTMAKLTARGDEVYVLIVTEGCSTQYLGNEEIIKEKKEEAIRSNNILGVKKVFFGDLPDMKLDTVPHTEINRIIENAIQEIRPHAVYTHFYGDVNNDHKEVFKSTMVAVRPVHTQCVKEVYCYQVPSSTEWAPHIVSDAFTPNIFVEISDHIIQKTEAIVAYQTEIRKYPHPRSTEVVAAYDEALAKKVGMDKVEGFVLIRKLIV